jgi:hypothetical protein
MKQTQKIHFLAKDTQNKTSYLGFIYYWTDKKSHLIMLTNKCKTFLTSTQNTLIVWAETEQKRLVCEVKRNLQLSIF